MIAQRASTLMSFAIATILAAGGVQAASVSINLTRGGAPTEAGFTNWATNDNSAPTNLTTGGLTFSVVDINAGTTLRSIDRGGNDGYAGTLPGLTQTWWGQRQGSTTAGGYITINVAGLTAGDYSFTSWHLDHEDQSGIMKIEVSTNGGVSFADAVTDFSLLSGDEGASAPIEQTFNFTATGADDVQFRFRNTSVDGVGASGTFAPVNGFTIVPEPSALLLGALGSLLLLRRRR